MNSTNLAIPIAIVIAGALIAGGLFFATSRPSSGTNAAAGQQPAPEATGDLEAMAEITSNDHIRGNPDAAVTIVEYADFECPFCKRFHFTMQQVVRDYDGKVAWVYRQFPLDQLHTKARKEAVASECAAEIGGNDAFWKYTETYASPSIDAL